VSPDDYLRERLTHHLPNDAGKEELIALLLPLLAMGARQSAATWQGLREEVAQAVVLALKDDAERHWRISWDGSLERANQIIAVGDTRADLAIQALGTMAKADAIKLATGRMEEAWELLDHAGRLYRMSHLPENEREIGWARTRIGRVYICAEVGKIEQGFAEAEEAREILEREAVWGRLVFLHNSWARTLDILNRSQDALPHYYAAITLLEQHDNEAHTSRATLYNNIAVALLSLGDSQQGLRYYEKALDISQANADRGAVGISYNNIATLYMERGQYGRALRMLYEAEPILRDSHPTAWYYAVRNLLRTYIAIHRLHEARETADRLLTQPGIPPSELLRTAYYIAKLEILRGDGVAARAALVQATHYATLLNSLDWIAVIRLLEATLALQEGFFIKAKEVGIALTAQSHAWGNTLMEMEAVAVTADALLAEGTDEGVYQVGQRVLSFARQAQNLPYRYRAHLTLGQSAERSGKTGRARRHYYAALETVGRIQRAAAHTLHADTQSGYQAALHHYLRLNLEEERIRSAFETLERSKSRLFLAYLQKAERLKWKTTPTTAPWLEELNALRARHFVLRRQLDDGNSMAVNEMGIVETRLRYVVERLYLDAAHEELQLGLPPNSQSLQAQLPPDTALLEYYDDGMRLWCFVLTREAIDVYPLPITHQNLVEAIETIYENQHSTLRIYLPDDPRASLQARKVRNEYAKLGEALLAPLGMDIARWRRLVVVPYGVLHRLPFNLLRFHNAYLIEQTEVVILPAAALLTRQLAPTAGSRRWVGYSNEGMLPFATKEASALQQRWGGELYTEANATRHALNGSACQVLHLSTHGVHRVDHHFDMSYFMLADNPFYGDDLLQLDFRHELVTLSACETGAVTAAPGEELIGLGRAFLYAGAGALVASLWQVREEITVTLMDHFYQHLFSGTTKAAALQQAQLAVLSGYPTLHPVYWGAFQLVGNATSLSFTPVFSVL
jgi:CHAT domain-containing protein